MEPGIYIPGWGGMRVEHDYLITDNGFERLSAHTVGLAGTAAVREKGSGPFSSRKGS